MAQDIESRRTKEKMLLAFRQHRSDNMVEMPEQLKILFSAFVDISTSRTSGFSGPNPLQWSEIESWARLNRWPLSPRHIRLLRAIDQAWLEDFYENAQFPLTGGRGGVNQPCTPQSFDAVFG
jgi:hypothetical protein